MAHRPGAHRLTATVAHVASGDHAQPGVQFLYVPARDLAAMRRFYGELVGLDEIHHSADEGLLAYRCGGLQFTVVEASDAPIPEPGWATQPGWQGDTRARVSWSVVLDSPAYVSAVDRLHAAGVDVLHEMPVWVGYWSFPVRDPMGNTVELSLPIEEPTVTTWHAWVEGDPDEPEASD